MTAIVNIEVAHMFKTIVVAIDGSEQAEHALATACDIAGKYKSEIHLVHSPELETAAIAVGSGAVAIAPSPEKVEEAGKQVMAQAVKQAKAQGCTPAESVIGSGDPADDILQQAEKSGADLIVTGRRGLGGLASLLLVSVSHKVSQNAPCTCMTVK